MTTPIGNRISDVKFEEGFTGNGKVFVHVEKQGDNSEKLVIYESNNALTAFFSNLFRNRSDTFTLREWAHRKLGDLPETFDKQRLTKNIKQLASKPCVETAPEILNKLISERKLDADETSVSKSIRFLPLGKVAFANELQTKLEKLSDNFGRTKTSATETKYFGKDRLDIVIATGSPLNSLFKTNLQLAKNVILGLGTDMPVTGMKDHPKIKEIVNLLGKIEELSGKPDEAIDMLKFLTVLLLAQEERPVSATNFRYVESLKLVIACLENEINARKLKQVQT